MKGNCGECVRRWSCQLEPESCGMFPDPVAMEFDSENEMLKAALDDLETIMFRGGKNIDTCNYCSSTTCYGRGGSQCCDPIWHGRVKW